MKFHMYCLWPRNIHNIPQLFPNMGLMSAPCGHHRNLKLGKIFIWPLLLDIFVVTDNKFIWPMWDAVFIPTWLSANMLYLKEAAIAHHPLQQQSIMLTWKPFVGKLDSETGSAKLNHLLSLLLRV